MLISYLNLSKTFTLLNNLEERYLNNKEKHLLPLHSNDITLRDSWINFFKIIDRLLYIKELDAKHYNVYQDYIDVIYSMNYYSLIVYWGDVPYYYGNRTVNNIHIKRIPKDEILSDLEIR